MQEGLVIKPHYSSTDFEMEKLNVVTTILNTKWFSE